MKNSLTLGDRMKIYCPYCNRYEGIEKYADIKVYYCELCGTDHIDPYNVYELYKIKIPKGF